MLRTAAVIACLIAAPALADLSLTMDSVISGRPGVTTLQFKGKKLLITMTRAEGEAKKNHVMLRDGDGKRLVILDTQAKTYTEVSDQQVADMKTKAAQMQAGLADKLAGLPPEQRAKLEAMMAKANQPPAAATASKYEFQKKGTSRKVLGKTCEEYLIKVDGVAEGEGCFISWKDAGVSRESVAEQLKAATDGLTQGSGSIDATFTVESSPGLPGWRKRVDASGAVLSETTLTKLSTDSIAASVFEVPKDYTLKPFGPPARPGKH